MHFLTLFTKLIYSWADKGYKKSHGASKWRKPFAGTSHAAGIVVEKVAVEAK
jgi:small subunit ribosomal protein S23e